MYKPEHYNNSEMTDVPIEDSDNPDQIYIAAEASFCSEGHTHSIFRIRLGGFLLLTNDSNSTICAIEFVDVQCSYTEARVFFLRNRVSCAFPTRCTCVEFQLHMKRESTYFETHEYSLNDL